MSSEKLVQIPDYEPHEPLLLNGKPFKVGQMSTNVAVEYGNNYKDPVRGFNEPYKWTGENVDGPFIPEINMTGLELEVKYDEQDMVHAQVMNRARRSR